MVYDPTDVTSDQAPGARKRPAGRRRADLPFEQYLKKKLDYIDKLNEFEERQRIQTYVTMTKRFRGDHFGFFSSDNSGKWIVINNPGLKKVNILSEVVRANTKNWMDANVQLEVTAWNSNNPDLEGAADIAQANADELCERDWDELFEEKLSDLAQLSSCYFIYSRYNKELGPTIQVPRMVRKDITIPGKYFCSACNASGPRAEAEEAGGCPNCSGPAQLSDPVEAPDRNVPDGYDEMPGGDTETVLFTAYEMKVDERNGKGGDLRKCRWIRNNYLVYRNELEELRPWAKLDGGGNREWSEGLKQARALETSALTGDNLGDVHSQEGDEDLLEFKRYWLDRKSMLGWVCPADYSHPCGFKIKAGQTIDEAYPEGFKGLYLERHVEELLIIDNDDKNERWSVGHFQADATAFWGKAHEDLLDLQEMLIEIVNIFFQAGMTMSLPPLIIDGMLFDAEDFVNDAGNIVYTRKGYDRTRAIADYIHQVEPSGPPEQMFALFNLLMQSKEQTSGVSAASTGIGDPTNRTMGGQQILAARSIGLMTASQKNKAKAKREWLIHQLQLRQQYWTPDRYAHLPSKYGEEWKEADVEAFRKADIRRDFSIKHIEGSDEPQTLEQKQQKTVALFASGLLENPQIPMAIKQKLVRWTGIDYDLEDYEAEIRLARARLRSMDREIDLIQKQGQAFAVDETGQPAIDQAGRPQVNPQAIQRVLVAPGAAIIPEGDNADVQCQFFVDQLKAEGAKQNPDPFRIEVFKARINEQAVAGAEQLAKKAKLTLIANAPLARAQGNKVAESLNYKDAPPDVKRQIEQQSGLQPSRTGSADEAGDDGGAGEQAADQAHEAIQNAQDRAQESDEKQKDRDHALQMKREELASKEKEAAKDRLVGAFGGPPAASAPRLSAST